MIADTVRRRFVDILQLILELLISMLLVEKFLVLGVIEVVVLAVSYVCPVVPTRQILPSRLVNPR